MLKSTYDTSKLIKIIGTAAGAAGATAFTVTAFDKVPDLTQEAAKLAAIILMKVYIDENDTGAPGSSAADENFEGTGFSRDEIAEFARGHAGDDNPAMGRPSLPEIEEALEKGRTSPGKGNSVRYAYNGVRVIVNRDVPWKSTT
ncbi:hypothetical protein [Nocardia sp. NPDC050412]|uniref:hypothetical protein n=1 Tax=Nocardia sp. NPDC050412 TaxID=3364320 RepID=UPI0037931B5A